LTNEEAAVLKNTLSNLQMAFVEVSQEKRGGKSEPATPPAPKAEAPESAASGSEEKIETPPQAPSESESRKKFTKSYGA
jgi:hypothetical protein